MLLLTTTMAETGGWPWSVVVSRQVGGGLRSACRQGGCLLYYRICLRVCIGLYSNNASFVLLALGSLFTYTVLEDMDALAPGIDAVPPAAARSLPLGSRLLLVQGGKGTARLREAVVEQDCG